jgi:hypothetical protein
MNLTTDNTFDELEYAMSAVQFPCAPVRPTMLAYGKSPTPADYRAHADAMEAYESALAAKVTARQAAWNEQNRILGIWKEKLRSEYSHLNDATFDACYSKAYEDGHSSGYNGEFRNCMDDITEFAWKIIKANAK